MASDSKINDLSKIIEKQNELLKSITGSAKKTTKEYETQGSLFNRIVDASKQLHVSERGYFEGLFRYGKELQGIWGRYGQSRDKARAKAYTDDVADMQRRKRASEAAAAHGKANQTVDDVGSILDTMKNVGPTDFLINSGKEMLESLRPAAVKSAEVGAGLLEAEEGMAGLGAAAVDAIPVIGEVAMAVEGVELGARLLYDLIHDTLEDWRALNKVAIGTDASTISRLRLFKDVLSTSLQTGVSQSEVRDIMGQLLKNGQQFSGTLKDDLLTATMLHDGLGVSSDSTAELAASAHGAHESFEGIADSLTRIQNRIGFSADSAARMALSINQSFDFLNGNHGLGEATKVTGIFAPLAQGLTSIGRGGLVDQLTKYIDSANSDPFSYGGLTGGVTGGNASSTVATLLARSRSLQGMNPQSAMAYAQAYSDTYYNGQISPQLLLDAYKAWSSHIEDYNKLSVEDRRAQDREASIRTAFNDQIKKSAPLFNTFENAFEAMVESLMTPAVSVLSTLLEAVNPKMQAWGAWLDSNEPKLEKAGDAIAIALLEGAKAAYIFGQSVASVSSYIFGKLKPLAPYGAVAAQGIAGVLGGPLVSAAMTGHGLMGVGTPSNSRDPVTQIIDDMVRALEKNSDSIEGNTKQLDTANKTQEKIIDDQIQTMIDQASNAPVPDVATTIFHDGNRQLLVQCTREFKAVAESMGANFIKASDKTTNGMIKSVQEGIARVQRQLENNKVHDRNAESINRASSAGTAH